MTDNEREQIKNWLADVGKLLAADRLTAVVLSVETAIGSFNAMCGTGESIAILLDGLDERLVKEIDAKLGTRDGATVQ